MMKDVDYINDFDKILADVVALLESARRSAARSVNAVMTATYWVIGWYIFEFEQGGRRKTEYGELLIRRLANDLTKRFGRGFGRSNLFQMRSFYLNYRQTVQTLSGLSANSVKSLTLTALPEKAQTMSAQFDLARVAKHFPLPWSHYARLLSVSNPQAREFYEQEALRCGWSVRQLDRQIATQFF